MNSSRPTSSTRQPYQDRAEAGRCLGQLLTGYAGRADLVVLGLPRGGVPVAAEVATALGAPLDVLLVRKIGLPQQPELAMGAIAGIGGERTVIRNERVLTRARVSPADFDRVCRLEAAELIERDRRYRAGRPPVLVTDRVVILVDDGLATGSTMRAAIAALRLHRPSGIVVAVPIGAAETCARLAPLVDELVCPWVPRGEDFEAVSQGYRDFRPTEDAEVINLLGSG